MCTLFDGKHSVLDIQEAYTRKFGDLLFSSRMEEVLEQLDNCFFLDNEHFRNEKERIEEAFRSSPVRRAVHAGGAYEADKEALVRQLDGYFTGPEGPGKSEGKKASDRLSGLMAPHIDLRRGGDCFAWAYAEVARETSARTFVILGISHMETRSRFVLTRKSFETPLGTIETDGEFVDTLAEALGDGFYQDEFVHRKEHSIEFQVLFLQYLFPERKDIRIVPILCSSLHDIMESGADPLKDWEISVFLGALKRAVKDRGDDVCCVAGVDLSHIGGRFGQFLRLSPSLLQEVERDDRRMLDPVLRRDPAAFFKLIREEKNARNVCGVPAIYALLSVTEPKSSRLLKYGQAEEENTQSVVSFAGVGFYGE